jgi:hypothetical protein
MWRRFVLLSSLRRRLLFRALVALARARTALWIYPFSRFRRPEVAAVRGGDPASIVWAINTAARMVPRATCLVRALAAQRLLASHGHVSELRIGVASSAATGFEAHAWVECAGTVLIGRTETQYARLLTWSAAQ